MNKIIGSVFIFLSLIGPSAAFAEGPYLPDAAWPVMRGDLQNTGRASDQVMSGCKVALDRAPAPAAPVFFKTGNGVFSTPVIDDRERVYVGSADHYFYAFDPAANSVLWKFDARELIDSAAALSADGRIYVPAGAAIYALDLTGKEIWAFDVTNHRPPGLYTFGTNYWWEGNVVVGPDRRVYSGNDDFFFYAINPEGTMRWAFRTGFLIWSIPAFRDELMFFAGFDMRLYALERETGRLRWKNNLKNALVASPALGPDGTIYQGSFNGNLYALAPTNGKILWTMKTDSHIYASAAVDKHGVVYVTSTDGFLYAVDGKSGRARWTFYTGDAVRSSPALGPDPEDKAEYLIYFGGGQGEVFAIDPSGNRRWSLDTLALVGDVDYPNLNASPALGRRGLAIANADGEVFYVPYGYYLQPGAGGITRDPTEGFGEDGAAWHFVSPGGLIDKASLISQTARLIHAGQVLTLRLAVRDQGRILRAQLEPGSARVESAPVTPLRMAVIGDDQTVTIRPESMFEPGKDYAIRVTARWRNSQSASGEVSGTLKVRVPETGAESGLMKEGVGFTITHMALPQPPIVPSLDQIGVAIMRIPFAVVSVDREKNTFVAWAAQKYGAAAGGEEQGIPDSRSLVYALAGQVQGDDFTLEARNCSFEESSFPFPLDDFRLSGRLTPEGAVEKGASLFAELDPPPILSALGMMKVSSEEASSGQESWVGSALQGGGSKGFLSAALVSGPTVAGYIAHKIWEPWDIYNHEGKFVATGTFRMAALSGLADRKPQGLSVKRFDYDPMKKEVTAEVAVSGPEVRGVMIGILLVDNQTGKPVPVNYNLVMRRQRLADGTKKTTLPAPAHGNFTAYLMADLWPLGKIMFTR